MTAPAEIGWRRSLARALSRQATASAATIAADPPGLGGGVYRIGITGPPGVGKSSMIAALAERRMVRKERVGVLAIDPTSPISGGSLLGDRVRMDRVAEGSGLFIRSVSSGSHLDGLCPNVLGLLDSFDRADFDEVILETVGVGQTSYAGRYLVDTFVLTLAPESGDTVQAMKGGILETADIYVVNKADLGAAERLTSELRTISSWRGDRDGWTAPVVLVSAMEGRGLDELDAAIDRHRAATASASWRSPLMNRRRDYLLRTLIQQRVDEVLAGDKALLSRTTVGEAYVHMLDRLLIDPTHRPSHQE